MMEQDILWFKQVCLLTGLFSDINVRFCREDIKDYLWLTNYLTKSMNDPYVDSALVLIHTMDRNLKEYGERTGLDIKDPKVREKIAISVKSPEYPLSESKNRHVSIMLSNKNLTPTERQTLYKWRLELANIRPASQSCGFADDPDAPFPIIKVGDINAAIAAAGKISSITIITMKDNPETLFLNAVVHFMVAQQYYVKSYSISDGSTEAIIFGHPMIDISSAADRPANLIDSSAKFWQARNTVIPLYNISDFVNKIIADYVKTNEHNRFRAQLNKYKKLLIQQLNDGDAQFPSCNIDRDRIELCPYEGIMKKLDDGTEVSSESYSVFYIISSHSIILETPKYHPTSGYSKFFSDSGNSDTIGGATKFPWFAFQAVPIFTHSLEKGPLIRYPYRYLQTIARHFPVRTTIEDDRNNDPTTETQSSIISKERQLKKKEDWLTLNKATAPKKMVQQMENELSKLKDELPKLYTLKEKEHLEFLQLPSELRQKHSNYFQYHFGPSWALSFEALRLSGILSLGFVAAYRGRRIPFLYGVTGSGKSSLKMIYYGLYPKFYIAEVIPDSAKPMANLKPYKLILIGDDYRLLNKNQLSALLRWLEGGEGIHLDQKHKNVDPKYVNCPQFWTSNNLIDVVTIRKLTTADLREAEVREALEMPADAPDDQISAYISAAAKKHAAQSTKSNSSGYIYTDNNNPMFKLPKPLSGHQKKALEAAETDQAAVDRRLFTIHLENKLTDAELLAGRESWDDYCKNLVNSFNAMYFQSGIRKCLEVTSDKIGVDIFDINIQSDCNALEALSYNFSFNTTFTDLGPAFPAPEPIAYQHIATLYDDEFHRFLRLPYKNGNFLRSIYRDIIWIQELEEFPDSDYFSHLQTQCGMRINKFFPGYDQQLAQRYYHTLKQQLLSINPEFTFTLHLQHINFLYEN